MVVAFFELRLSGLARFPLWLDESLKKKDGDVEYVYFYEQDDIALSDKQAFFSSLPHSCRVIKGTMFFKMDMDAGNLMPTNCSFYSMKDSF